MSRMKASIMALFIAVSMFIHVHRPADHEKVSESPTRPQYGVVQPDIIAENLRARVEAYSAKAYKPKRAEVVKQATYEFEATFYTARCEGCSGITSSGVDVRNTTHFRGYRVLAADRSVPFGTIMRITLEDGTVFDGIVADRGGDIGQGRLDVLVGTKARAYELGRQQVRVEILK